MCKMQKRIEDKLEKALNPTNLKVVNQSISHKGHAGDDGSGESHFLVMIEAENLKDMSKVVAQRRIYEILEDEIKIIHALSLKIN